MSLMEAVHNELVLRSKPTYPGGLNAQAADMVLFIESIDRAGTTSQGTWEYERDLYTPNLITGVMVNVGLDDWMEILAVNQNGSMQIINPSDADTIVKSNHIQAAFIRMAEHAIALEKFIGTGLLTRHD